MKPHKLLATAEPLAHGAPVPEPSALALAALALVPLAWRRRGLRNLACPRFANVRFASLLIALPVLLGGPSAWGVTLEWTRQLGTSESDSSLGVSADGLGNVYISGATRGSLDGTNVGGEDAFVSKYNAAGNLQWTRQLGTSSLDESRSVSADGLGNVYISGTTYGSLGGLSVGGSDAFVGKYDGAGNLQWTRQLGSLPDDVGFGVSADGLGNVYISGRSYGLAGPSTFGYDAFVGKYDAAGNLQWTREFGTSENDWSYGVSADGLGNVYISGYTRGNLGGPNAGGADAFVRKYDAAGNLQWTRQLGSSSTDYPYPTDYAAGVSADGLGNVYISGYTEGSLDGMNAGGTGGAFVAKYDAAGNLQWTQQSATSFSTEAYGVSADGVGSVYISGKTDESLGGPNAGGYDAFVSKYNAAGNLQWTQQLGTSTSDFGKGVSADGLGNVYISGTTLGSLGGPNAGGNDAFVAKFSETSVPEPSTLLLAALALTPMVLRRNMFDRRTLR